MLNFKKGVKMEMQFTKSSIEVVITNSETSVDVERYDEELQEEIVNTLCLTLEYIKVHDNG